MELTRKQEESLKIIFSRFLNREKYVTISGYAGTGKAQPVDTIIPTPEGKKRLGDIKKGDYVFDRHGNKTKVLGVFPQGVIDSYIVTLEDGRQTLCNDEHLFSYYTNKGNINTKSVKDMLQMGLKHSERGCFKFKIPNNEPIQWEEKEYEIDPYIIGAFLGDGCCKERQLTISSGDPDLVKEISRLLSIQLKEKITEKRNSEFNYNWQFLYENPKKNKAGNSLLLKIQTQDYFKNYSHFLIGGAESKRIPEEYKTGSVEQRLALLQGLMDTDGSISNYDEHRYNIRYTSINLGLIKDIQEILYSLGWKSTIITDNRKEKYTTGICYTLLINMPNEDKYKIFRLKRKKDIALEAMNYPKRKDYSKLAIVNIEKEEVQREMVCIYVDNPEHLYLTNDCIVTHNTTLVKFAIEALNIPKDKVAYATFTGKAAEVLRKKGNDNACTLHKLLYEHFPKKTGGFFRRPKRTLDYSVIVVDEVSMVPKSMIDLLLSHIGIFVIFLGDPFQIPQISKTDTHDLLDHPHIFLDEIMRQAKESEIVRLSMDIREGKEIDYFSGKEMQVVPKSALTDGTLKWADIIICSTNRTRHEYNNKMRKILGFEGAIPQDNEKIIIKRNYWDIMDESGNALVNGTIGTVENSFETFIKVPKIVTPRDIKMPIIHSKFNADGNTFGEIEFDKNFLLKEEPCIDWQLAYKMGGLKEKIGDIIPKQATWGYAITCHAAQGSQWDNVLILEEKFPFDKMEHARWLYTACTRSVFRLILVRG